MKQMKILMLLSILIKVTLKFGETEVVEDDKLEDPNIANYT